MNTRHVKFALVAGFILGVLLAVVPLRGQNQILGNAIIQNTVRFTGDITPTQLTADVNDYAPANFSSNIVLRMSSDATRTITGLAGGTEGRWIWLWNVGSQAIVLKSESALSVAANRFALANDYNLAAGASVQIIYDATSSRWRAGGSADSGTVSSVSVTTANGVSGSVANATTTPAISLTLGDITPTSVAASGTVTGSNLSGTNTGQQTIAGTAGEIDVNVASLTSTISLPSTITQATTFSANTFVVGANAAASTSSIYAGTDTTARLELTETLGSNGGWMAYEGASNRLRIGTNLSGADTAAINIARASSQVDLLGALTVASTTASTSTTTGSGIFGGGLGVAGAGYFGGVLSTTHSTAGDVAGAWSNTNATSFGGYIRGGSTVASGKYMLQLVSADAATNYLFHSDRMTAPGSFTLGGNLTFGTSGSVLNGTTGSIGLTATGTNQSITLAPSGTGHVSLGSTVNNAKFRVWTSGTSAYGLGVTAGNLLAYAPTSSAITFNNLSTADGTTMTENARFSASSGSFLLGTATDSSNGRLQLATHTTSAGGIGFGTDTPLYRQAASTLELGAANAKFRLNDTSNVIWSLRSSAGYLTFGQDTNGVDGVRFSGSTLATGNASVLYTTASTSTTTGSLTTAGGLGVGGNGFFGGGIDVATTIKGGTYAAIGGSLNAGIGLQLIPSTLGGVTQYGINSSPTFSSAATNFSRAGSFKVTTAAASYTTSNTYGLFVDGPTIGAGHTASTNTGLYIVNQGTTGVTNAYGINIAAQSGAATTNVGLQNAGTTLLTNATASSSTSTGSLVVSGGVGVAGAIYSASLYATGDVEAGSGSVRVGNFTTAPSNVSQAYVGRTSGSGSGTYAEAGHLVLYPRTSAGVYRHISMYAAESGDGIGYETLRVESANSGGGNKGLVKVLGTTASSSTSTGALTVAGGLGVAGAGFFGGNVRIAETAATYGLTARLRVDAPNTNTGPAIAAFGDSVGRVMNLYEVGHVASVSGTSLSFNAVTGSGFNLGVGTSGGSAGGTLQITSPTLTAFLNTTEATTGGAGSLTTAGGIYAAKRIFTATDLFAGNSASIGNTAATHVQINAGGYIQAGSNLADDNLVIRGKGTGKVLFGYSAGSGGLDVYDGGATNRLFTVGANGFGYATGSGGAVTQITSRTTGVTLNKASGAITLFTAAGSTTATSFTVTNSAVAATDTIVLSVKSSTNKYLCFVTAVAAGSFEITFYTTGGTSSDAPVINFAVIKAVAS